MAVPRRAIPSTARETCRALPRTLNHHPDSLLPATAEATSATVDDMLTRLVDCTFQDRTNGMSPSAAAADIAADTWIEQGTADDRRCIQLDRLNRDPFRAGTRPESEAGRAGPVSLVSDCACRLPASFHFLSMRGGCIGESCALMSGNLGTQVDTFDDAGSTPFARVAV